MKRIIFRIPYPSELKGDPNILVDRWGRQMDYLRIAVTDRCNLRCFYCMPEHGIKYVPKDDLLTYEEILRFTKVACSLGVNKVRITGGEPFVRKDVITLLAELKKIPGLKKLHITTNGILTTQYIDQLKDLGIDGVNLSLDSLNAENFYSITRRNEFENVMLCLNRLIEEKIPTKVNMVVMKGKNEHEIREMSYLTERHPIDVRFIEEMPFNGSEEQSKPYNHIDILNDLKSAYPGLYPLNNDTSDPAKLFKVPGFAGQIGIIPAHTRTFCGSCNRLRLTATGTIKNCLYDDGVVDVRGFLRKNQSDEELRQLLINTAQLKARDGHQAEADRKSASIVESMSTIGG